MSATKIGNLDALKTWLIKELTPICDADPSTLAKYVVALAKKDLPDSELKDLCTRELEVFMQDKTTGFVESLFKAFADKSYMEFAPMPIVPMVIAPVPLATAPVRLELPTDVVQTINNGQSIQIASPLRQMSPERSRTTSGSDLKERRRSKSQSRSPRRRDEMLRGGDLRQRLTDRRRFEPTDRPRSRYPRHDNYRRRSPGGRRSPMRRRSPRWSPGRGRSPGRRRSPPFGRGHQKSRSLSRSRPRSWSRPRSRPRSPRSPKVRSRSSSLSGSSTSPRRRKSPASRSSTPLGEFSLDRKVNQPLTTPAPPAPAVVQSRSGRPRCRDYDEKGFCMRGDLCPFDHGMDPVVVEDVHLSNVLKLQQGGIRGPVPRGPIPVNRPPPPTQGGARPTLPPPPNMPGVPIIGPANPPPPGTVPIRVPVNAPPPGYPQMQLPPEPYQPEPYQPQAPPPANANSSWPQDASKDPANMIEMGGPPEVDTAEVQTVPVHRRTVITSRYPHPYRGRGRGRGRGGFNYDRLGPKKYNSENATLEVQKIPAELNTIAKLNEHFSQFGEITNLQICFHGDPQAAAITFSTNAQANAAYRSTEPIFNNRFIKVFWHKKEDKGDTEGAAAPPPPPKEVIIPPAHKLQLNNRAPLPPPVDHYAKDSVSGVLSHLKADPSKLTEPEAPREPAPPQALTLNNRTKDPKLALKKKIEIQRKKQMLVQKQIEQQKILLKKLENKNMTSTDKATIMKTIRILASSVEKLRKELSDSNDEVVVAIAVSKKSAEAQKERNEKMEKGAEEAGGEAQFASKQQAQKAILDTELDLISKQNKGADITQLRQKVLDLKKEVASLGLLAPAARGRGRGRGRGYTRGRGFGFAHGGMRSLDKRPKEILVTGFSVEEKDEVLSNIQSVAEIEKSVFEDEPPSLLLSFLSRSAAEKVFKEAGSFKERQLLFQWQPPLVLSSPKAVVDPVIVQASPDSDNAEAPSLVTKVTVKQEVKEEVKEDVKAEVKEEELDDADEDVLLGLDEDDEEHDERSSWKR